MPQGSNEFASLVLAGEVDDPPPPQTKKSLEHRDTLISGVAKKISTVFNLPLGATKIRLSQDPPPMCGCVFAAAALFGHGLIVNYPRADAISRNMALPVDLAAKSYVFEPFYLKPLPANRNILSPIPPKEFRADPNQKYSTEFSIAAQRLGVPLPFFDD